MKGLSWQTCPWKETTGISGDVSPHAKDLFSVNEQSNNIDYVTATMAELIVTRKVLVLYFSTLSIRVLE
jgi:hypothetical protein